MNCKDYKEAIAAEPSKSFDAGSHAATCGSCAAFGDAILALDMKIAKALDLPVPDLVMPPLPPLAGSGDRLVNIINFPFRRGILRGAPAWIGLAASVLLVTVLGVRFMSDDVAYATLANEIIAHLDHEPRALRVTTQPVSAQRLAAVMRDDIAYMRGELGLITYVNSCEINGRKAAHLVLQGERGPITLLLLPGETLDSAVPLQGDGIAGVILPVGKGSIAFIGDREESLDEIERRVTNAVKWIT